MTPNPLLATGPLSTARPAPSALAATPATSSVEPGVGPAGFARALSDARRSSPVADAREGTRDASGRTERTERSEGTGHDHPTSAGDEARQADATDRPSERGSAAARTRATAGTPRESERRDTAVAARAGKSDAASGREAALALDTDTALDTTADDDRVQSDTLVGDAAQLIASLTGRPLDATPATATPGPEGEAAEVGTVVTGMTERSPGEGAEAPGRARRPGTDPAVGLTGLARAREVADEHAAIHRFPGIGADTAAVPGSPASPPAHGRPDTDAVRAGHAQADLQAALATHAAPTDPEANELGRGQAAADALQAASGQALPSSSRTESGHATVPADLPAALAAATAGSTPSVVSSSRAEVQLPARPGQPEFAPQLGAQLTMFVRDGVQVARVHLHPAELGPVLVQIQLDGQAAQVHLAAENPLTRQALGDALPVLAGSLREAGLTLAGGGVFEQPRQGEPRSGNGMPSPRHGRDDDGAAARIDTPLALPAGTRRRGVVDLVA
jgi:flagellar hook-length control protein FliK